MVRGLIAVAILASMGACAAGKPPGFAEGTSWSAPLVGALEDGIPIVPVQINGKGPYLFALNLDALSMIDPGLAKELGLWETRDSSQKGVDSGDKVSVEQLVHADIPSLAMGTLTLTSRRLVVMKTGANYHGRPILGTIGNDLITETVIWALDRDRSVLHMATQGHMQPAAEANRVEVRVNNRQTSVKAKLNDKTSVELLVRYHDVSALWPQVAKKAELQSLGVVNARVGDKVHEIDAWEANTVSVGNDQRERYPFLAFLDKRFRPEEYDGVLGREFWSKFYVMSNLHERALWLQPRASDPAELTMDRLRRWGTLLTSCEQLACIDLQVTRESAPVAQAGKARGKKAPPPPPPPPAVPRLVIKREEAMKDTSYDVILQALDDSGTPLLMPYLLLALPKGVMETQFELASINDAYSRAGSFRVIDATPFPPPCNAPTGCIWLHR